MRIEIKNLNAMRFTKLFIAASRWISKYADVLNDLNVFPVPDGDTGTNISMTLQSVENDLVKLDHEPTMKEFVNTVSDSILIGARGTSGIIFGNIIYGFLSSVKDKDSVTIDDVADAFVEARNKAYATVLNPKEGTILTVVKEVADAAINYQGDKNDFILFLVYLKNVAYDAVKKTPELFPILKENAVVDAGAMGFFYLLEGFEKSVSDPEMLKDLDRIIKSQAIRSERLGQIIKQTEISKYKYNLEFLLESDEFDIENYKEKISEYGNVSYCVQIGKKTKTQINTDFPWDLLKIGDNIGRIYNINLENLSLGNDNTGINNDTNLVSAMFNTQNENVGNTKSGNENSQNYDIAIVTDSGSDLTNDLINDLKVSIIPLKLKVKDNYYSDGIEFTKKEIWTLYRKELIFPKISPPSPSEFQKLYKDLFDNGYKKIISIHISNKISGTQQAAKVAKSMFDNANDIYIIDSKSLSLPLGNLVLKAAEMVKDGIKFDDIIKKINENIGKMDVFLFAEDLSFLNKSKRITSFASSWGKIFQYKPRLKLKNENIILDGANFGYKSVLSYVKQLLNEQYGKNNYTVYSLWGGGTDQLLKANAIKDVVISLGSNFTFSGNFQIGSSIANYSGPVFGIGIIAQNF
jgi:DegV family protein with EDD domain